MNAVKRPDFREMPVKANITDLIPQRAPIIMVDGIISSNDTQTITSFRIEESNIFCSGGYFREPGLIENIAQSAAAAAGYERKSMGLNLLTGFIGAVKNLEIIELPEVGEEIETSIDVIHNIFNVKIVNGTVRRKNGKICASCEMKIFLNEEESNE